MKTVTIKVDRRTKAGKVFMAILEVFLKDVEGIEILRISSRK